RTGTLSKDRPNCPNRPGAAQARTSRGGLTTWPNHPLPLTRPAMILRRTHSSPTRAGQVSGVVRPRGGNALMPWELNIVRYHEGERGVLGDRQSVIDHLAKV